MVFSRILLLLAPLFLSSVRAVHLFVAETNGNLTTLSLARSEDGINNLTTIARTLDCGPNPSDLSLDFPNRILYCQDRGISSSVNGSINSFKIKNGGFMERIQRVDAPLSMVSSLLFGEPEKGNRRGIVTVSYNTSAVSVTGINKHGNLTPKEVFAPTFTTPGPVTARQDRSYLHKVLLDPSHRYLPMNDLGADMVRVFTWDKKNLAPLTEVSQLKTDPGVGPRHGAFWRSPNNGTLFYFLNGELDQKVHSYAISYTEGGLAWREVFKIPGLGFEDERPALTAPTSEMAITPDQRFLIVSSRDVSFPNSTRYQSGPTDKLSTFRIHEDGTLSLLQLAPSGGWSPRQFSINRAGNLVAVGHQNNNTVVVWERDVRTGLIETREPVGVVTLDGPVVMIVWDEEVDC